MGIRILLLLAVMAFFGTAFAQGTRPEAPVTGFNPTTASVNEAQLLGALKQVTGRVSLPDQKAGVLIQPEGPDWRDFQRGVVPWLAAVFVLGTCAALAVFYLVRGRIRTHGGATGRTITRFGGFERFMHWVTAVSWMLLALSGLNLAVGRRVLLPVIGESAFASFTQLAKYAHNFIAFPFMAGVVLMLLVWVRHNIPNSVDVAWFRQGGGIIGDAHPPAGKFNGGQKAIFWIVVLGGLVMAASGLLLMFPFTVTDVSGMQTGQMVHGVLALLMIAAMLAHIYIGTLGMEGAFDAMGTGQVDEAWAKAHHSLWVEEEQAKMHGAAE
jgi:formate dehydrogenase subunit gamma